MVFAKLKMDEYELEDFTQNQTFYYSIWKSVLIDSFKENNSFVELVKNGLLESCSISIFYSEIDELILSDNHVLWNTGKVSRYKNLEYGVYFPINKNILVGIINYGGQCNPGDYVFIKGNHNFFNYINYLLKNNATNYIGFDKNNISLHISSNFDKKLDWDSMFEK